MKEEQKSQSGTPLIIIGIVLVIVVLGGWYMYSSSKSAPRKAANNATPGATPKIATIPPNAPPGATPPNMLGSPTASVTVEEFADFQCPSCGSTHPILKQIQSMYGSRIKFIFRNFPLPMHDKSYDAAVAAEAAGMQGKFWDMHNQLFTNQKTWSADPNYREVWAGYAQKIGLDVEKWKNDMAGLPAKSRVDADLQRGRGLNINTTPTVFIDDKQVPYPEVTVEGLKNIIDSELQNAQQSQAKPAAPASNAGANTTTESANAPSNSK
ncbi:MAG TPA: thioredoxin domain-containing protein [Pyrinomonadaceae bacterium]|jgi:protein-disulfide isomerase|nr:thioredoxin domain-containing protein [Pyrinomonadaceae bacterium]